MTQQTESRDQVSKTSAQLGISDELLSILVCPIDHASLVVEHESLACTQCGRHFPVTDGIPNMVVD